MNSIWNLFFNFLGIIIKFTYLINKYLKLFAKYWDFLISI